MLMVFLLYGKAVKEKRKMTKNEALIENISKEGLKKLENFCSKFKGYKTLIDKKSYDKKLLDYVLI